MRHSTLRSAWPRRVPAEDVLYPESDGKPMAETDLHRDITVYLIEALKLWFRTESNVYVSGDLMMYYVEGNTNISISPDVFVVKGVPQYQRRVYKLWQEGKTPCVVIEVSSLSTKLEDLRTKFEVYRDVLRVAEYYIFDPQKEYLPGRFRAWSLRRGRYVERRIVGGRIRSPELGLVLWDERGMLRLIDPRSGRVLPALSQAEDDRCVAEAGRREAEAGRREAEAGRREAEAALKNIQEENRKLRAALQSLSRGRRGRE